MLRRYLNVLVLSSRHYYHETPLLVAIRSNSSIRRVDVSRYSTEEVPWADILFIDPNLIAWDKDGRGFDRVCELILLVRGKYPEKVVVLCSDVPTIHAFVAANGDRFAHYFQLDDTAIDAAPDPRVDDMIEACQVELSRNIRLRFEYDIALSFAGEQRVFAEEIATGLRNDGLSVFYDDFERSDLWGRDLYTHLHDIYSRKAQYCVIFASAAYASKLWTNHERQAAQERALHEKGAPYILPIRCDDSEIPGLSMNVAYLRIEEGISVICGRILEKMGVVQSA